MKKRAFLFSLGIGVVALTVYYLGFSDLQRDYPDDAESSEAIAGTEGAIPFDETTSQRDQSESASVARLKLTRVDASRLNDASVSYTSAASVADYLSAQAEEFGWSERQRLSNASLWAESCKRANALASAPEVNLQEVGFSNALVTGIHELSQFCGNIDIDAELRGLDLLEEISEFGLRFDGEINQLSRDLSESGASDLATQVAFRLLRTSLDRHDEGSVSGVLRMIAHHELYESISLDDPEFKFIYPSIIDDVAVSLLCAEQDGCFGKRHPIVLRYCMQKYLSGSICSSPSSISEAIFQTSTPVQYGWFNAYHNYVVRQLIDL